MKFPAAGPAGSAPAAGASRAAYRSGHAVGSFGMGVVHGFTGVHPLSKVDDRAHAGVERRVGRGERRTAGRPDGPDRRAQPNYTTGSLREPQTYTTGPLEPERTWDVGGEGTRTAEATSGAGVLGAAFGLPAVAGPPNRAQLRPAATFPMAQDGSKPVFPSGDPRFARRGGAIPMGNAEGALKPWGM